MYFGTQTSAFQRNMQPPFSGQTTGRNVLRYPEDEAWCLLNYTAPRPEFSNIH